MSDFKPYPVEVFPAPLRGFVTRVSKSIGCDPSFPALPLLAMLAAAIGNSRCLVLRTGWAVMSILWAVVIGESGTSKTPAFKAAIRPMEHRQRLAFERHHVLMEQFEQDHAEWRRSSRKGDAGAEPIAPLAERCKVQDTTVEALAPLLRDNPRGLLLARDELAGWLGSFDKYTGGGGSDSAAWLSLFNGNSITVDRKSGDRPTIHVPSPHLSIAGGIQPETLRRALGVEHRASGLAARLLLAYPPRRAKRWTEDGIDPDDEAALERVVNRLYELQPESVDGRMQPVALGLSRPAKDLWIKFYDEHATEMSALSGDLAAAYSKLEEYTARLALVLHLAEWAAGDGAKMPGAISATSMRAGITLARWHANEARRVYAMLDCKSDEQTPAEKLVNWIREHGGTVTPREVQRGCGWIKTSGQADAALQELVDAEFGTWVSVPTTSSGGRPTRHFQLSTASTLDTTHENRKENLGCVSVESVDAPRDESADILALTRDPNDWEVA